MNAQIIDRFAYFKNTADQPLLWAPSIEFFKIAIGCMLAGTAMFELVLFVVAPEQTTRALIVLNLAAVALLAWGFLAAGMLKATVRTLCAGAWFYVTLTSFFYGGINATGILLYPLTILMAGWLIGTRAAMAVALLTSATTLFFVLGEGAGWLPLPPPTPPALRWVVQSIVVIFSAVIIAQVVRSYRGRIEEIRQLGSDLAIRSAELLAREGDLNRAQAVAHIGSWVYDIANDITQLSAETCRILGVPEGTRGSYDTYLSRVHADDRSSFALIWQTVRKEGGPLLSEHRVMVGKAARRVSLIAELEYSDLGEPARVVGTIQDITERRRAEEVLHRTRVGVDSTMDALFWITPDARFVDVNPAAYRSLGYTRDELLQMGVPDIDADYAGENWRRHFEELRKHGSTRFETSHRTRDGRQFPVEIVCSYLQTGSGEQCCAFVRDISARKRHEAELLAARTQLEATLAAIPDLLFEVDLEGRYYNVHSGRYDLLAAPPEQLIGKTVVDVLSPAAAKIALAALHEANETGRSHGSQFELSLPQGETCFELSISRKPVVAGEEPRFIVLSRDVTERNKAVEALRSSEMQLQCVLGSTADGILTVDNDGKVIQTNRRFAELWRIPEAVLASRNDATLLDCVVAQLSEPEAFLQKVQSLYRSDAEDSDTVEFKDGRVFERFSAPLIQNGVVAGRVWSFRDVTARLQAAKELQLQEERLRLAMQATRQGWFDLNMQSGEVVVSPEYARILGYEPAEFSSNLQNWVAAIHPDDRPILMQAFAESVETGESRQSEYRRKTSNGEWKWIGSIGKVVERDASGKAVRMIGAHADISERRRAEDALRIRDRALQHSLDAVAMADVDGHLTYVNEAFLRLWRLDAAEEALGRSVADFWQDPAAAQQVVAAIMKAGEWRGELIAKRRDGASLQLEVAASTAIAPDGTVLAMMASFADVTERKRAERSLSLAVDVAQVLVWEVDFPHDRLMFDVSRLVQLGVEIATTPTSIAEWIACVHEDDRKLFEQRVAQAVQPGDHVFDYEYRMPGKAGAMQWIYSKGRVVQRDAAGRPLLAVGTSMNVTARKKAELALANLNADLEMRVAKRTADLEMANRELNSFSYTIAHDMRAPVRAINGFSEMVLQANEGKLDATSVGYLQRVVAGSRHMGELIDDLLNLARLSRQEMRQHGFNLSELAAGVVANLTETQPERAVKVTIEPAMHVVGDPGLMRAVLDNLIGNAWKFTLKKSDATIDIGVEQRDGWPAYFVRDNGAGFDMQYAHKLFAPFQRLHHISEFDGTGIGLATVKKIIERHGGKSWIDSAVDHGTVVYFTIGRAD